MSKSLIILSTYQPENPALWTLISPGVFIRTVVVNCDVDEALDRAHTIRKKNETVLNTIPYAVAEETARKKKVKLSKPRQSVLESTIVLT